MRGRRVPSPPAVRAADSGAEGEGTAELLEVKVEPEVWFEQLPESPARRRARRGMLQLGEQPSQRMAGMPSKVRMTKRPSVDGRRTAIAAAAARGAAGSGLDSDGDSSLPDPDQFLETELASGKPEASMDEDLTSLSWLQDRDLLKGIQLRPAPVASPPLSAIQKQEVSSEPEEQSPTSDYLEEGPDDPPPPTPLVHRCPERFNARRYLDYTGCAYDPKIHSHMKPPFSFSCLIFMAIEDSRCKALPVREIYGWIEEHFPFYQAAAVGWKNSVRHNLSLNKCFKRVDRTTYKSWMSGRSKGSFWTVEPLYRSGLIETLQRSPNVYSWRYGGHNRMRLARNKQPNVYGQQGWRRGKDGTAGTSGGGGGGGDPDGGPNPRLFPFLAARLMSGPGPEPERSPRRLPDAGPDPLAGAPDRPECLLLTPQSVDRTYRLMREGHFSDLPSSESGSCSEKVPCFQRVMMISRSAAEDHTYAFSPACCPGGGGGHAVGGRRIVDSEDEAFSDDSNLSQELRVRKVPVSRSYLRAATGGGRAGNLTPEEVEGADLLLNLAGVSRAGSRAPSPQAAPAPARARGPRRRPGRPRASPR